MKDAIKKPPTPCPAHEIMRMMYHDVMRWEPEQCFTVDILLHDSIWLQSIVKKRSAPRCLYEIMRINECVVEHRIVQRVNQLFYITHVALILFVLWYCAILYTYCRISFLKRWIDS